jgi:hypothetical protein
MIHSIPKSGSLRGERPLGNIVNQVGSKKNTLLKNLCNLTMVCSVFLWWLKIAKMLRKEMGAKSIKEKKVG